MPRIALLCLILLLAGCSCAIHYENLGVADGRKSLSEQQVSGIVRKAQFVPRPMEKGLYHYQSQDIDLWYDPQLETLRIQSSHCVGSGLGAWEARCKTTSKSVARGFTEAGLRLEEVWSSGQETRPVPTKLAAMRVAEAVWVPIYGEENIAAERPFEATLRKGVWHVSGTQPGNVPMVGGVAHLEVRKSDGKVLKVSHGK